MENRINVCFHQGNINKLTECKEEAEGKHVDTLDTGHEMFVNGPPTWPSISHDTTSEQYSAWPALKRLFGEYGQLHPKTHKLSKSLRFFLVLLLIYSEEILMFAFSIAIVTRISTDQVC